MQIGFIGLGRLGLPCAEVLAQHHDVIGYDIAAKESRLITIAKRIEQCVRSRDIIFIAVPTPHASHYEGSSPSSEFEPQDFNYSVLKEVLGCINPFLHDHQVVAIISTVLPGTIRRECAPQLDKAKLVYNPYLVAMGTEKQDMRRPEMIIIGTKVGCSKDKATHLLAAVYNPIITEEVRMVIGTWEEAESIKIFYNTFISVKIALVNMIQDVAQKNGHINVDIVTEAIAQSTKRITSTMYMTAGMGDGGPCHPRDNIALRYLAKRLDLGYDLFGAIMTSREIQAEHLARTLVSYNNPVVILGKTYKPGVPYIDGSYSLLVGYYVSKFKVPLYYYDPNTLDVYPPPFDGPVTYLIAHWDRWVDEYTFRPGSVVVDPWRRFATTDSSISVIHYGNTRDS